MANLRTTVKIGAHRCLWTPDGGTEIDLGFTEEGVVIEINQGKAMRGIHESTAPYGAVEDEAEITSEVVLKETPNATVAAALGALLTTEVGPPAAESVDLNPTRGEEASFGKLVFRPRKLASSDKSQDKTIWNAINMGSSSRPFLANADQTVTMSVQAGLYWDAVAEGYKLYTEGDPATDVTFQL